MSGQRYDWEARFAAGDWAHLGSLAEAPRFALIAGFVHRIAGRGAVLDAGCGEGHLYQYLDSSRIVYYGFDLSATAIANAHRLYPGGRFGVSTIEAFEPPLGGRYDVIVFNESLQYIRAPFETVDRYSATLNPSGLTIISTFQNPSEDSSARILSRKIDAAIEVGRYRVVTSAEVTNGENGLRWRVTALR